jgi:hypothetical protein
MASDAEDRGVSVVLTMDCLPAGGRAAVRCPDRWSDAEASAAAFVHAMAAQGLTATLFVAEQAAARLRGVLEEARAAGCEAALLCHPQLGDYQTCLGAYNYDRQREIVSVARRKWEDALGETPRSFRAGSFSANDYTFQVLCMEEFRQGSCSLPGRMDGEQCSMWYGAHPFPHHTDPLDRARVGTMEFLEVPVTSDFEAAGYMTYETYTPPHLRIEEPDVHEYARGLVEFHLDRMEEDEVECRVIHLVTSNLVGWGREADPHVERLSNLCAMLREVAGERGLEVRSASLAGLHEAWDERMGAPWRLERLV